MTATKKKKKNWSMSIGPRGNRIYLFENGKGGVLYYETRDPALKSGYRCRSLKHRDRKRAEQWARGEVAKLMAGDESLRDPTPTAEKIFGAYLAHKSPGKGPLEKKADRRRVRMWMNFLGRKFDLSKLTLQRWNLFIKARKSGAIDAQGRPRG